MQKPLPPLGWLRTFEAAARHLSFTGAARDLNMTQSAVSQQIKALEGHLGKPLFFRRPKALELTEAGVTFIPVVRDAIRMLSRGTRAITGGEENAVTVQSNLTFAIHWLAPRIARFRARHPEVSQNLMTEIWEPQAGSLAADIVIRFSLRPADDVRAKFLFRDHYYPVFAPQDPVTLGLCKQVDLDTEVEKATKRKEKERIAAGLPPMDPAGTLLPTADTTDSGVPGASQPSVAESEPKEISPDSIFANVPSPPPDEDEALESEEAARVLSKLQGMTGGGDEQPTLDAGDEQPAVDAGDEQPAVDSGDEQPAQADDGGAASDSTS